MFSELVFCFCGDSGVLFFRTSGRTVAPAFSGLVYCGVHWSESKVTPKWCEWWCVGIFVVVFVWDIFGGLFFFESSQVFY